ncbi:MAG: amino acid adenylation domain-containing protein [Spirochaetales bacterium]|nr:amino acid adenylation domain-containing protein [Spirochaetales bacterium]
MLPLSKIQEQYWLAYERDPANSAYHLPFLYEIRGALDYVRLEKALARMGERHGLFALNDSDDSRFSVIHKVIRSPQEMDRFIGEPFDLRRDKLLRLYHFEEGEKQYLLLLFHHIIFDLRSKQLFADELASLYGEGAEGEESLPRPYGEYRRWFEEFSSTEKYGKMRAYWEKEALENYLLPLPSDRERPPLPSSRGKRFFRSLSPALTASVDEYSRRRGSDPFLVLLTAYALCLHRFSGQDAFTIGIPRTNRPEGFENTLGCFVNILPLCLRIEKGLTFSGLLRQVRLKMLGMHRNQYVPYLEVAALSKAKRDIRYNPLFQVGFTYEPQMALKLNGAECLPLEWAPEAAQLDLFFSFRREGDRLRWAVEYGTDLFTRERAEGFFASFQALLERGMAGDDRPLQELSPLDERTAAKMEGWNRTDRPYRFSGGIHRFFTEQARTHPEKTALIFGEETLSYGELYRRACALARTLRKRGVERETIVGISLERSFEMVVALYAVVLAGGSYLPIEPTLPADYLNYILDDSQVSLILTGKKFRDPFPAPLDVIDLDGYDYSAEGEGELPQVHPDDRVYILYTSGSTGRPKGVEITHRGLMNRILWMNEEYRLTEGDVLIQKTPYNFDVSGWEFWWPSLNGCPLVIAEPGGHRDNDYLINLIDREKVSLIHFVPSMLREFLKSCRPGQCLSLRDVICSGEALPAAVVREFYRILPHSRLHNLYGPTEASIDVTYRPCEPHCVTVPIGRPIANTKIHILDESLNALPPGMTGEIYLAGTGLARGYLNKAELTAERFVPNPFDGGRMYKTGDLGQWTWEGEILYQGRNDSQIQLHGLRVELGEIENVLTDHPQVEAAALIVRGDFGAEQSLAAFAVKQGDLTAEELKIYLRAHLPLHMVPPLIVFTEELKLNSNGKLDRKSLPPLESMQNTTPPEFHSPRGESEHIVAGIWKEILNLDRVGREEHFFELGGTSLHIVRMQRKLSEKTGRTLPVTDLFSHTTVKALAEYLDRKSGGEGEKEKLTHRADRTRKAASRLRMRRKK